MTDTDRIEKRVVLRAPLARVWRAIADSREFGEWFRVRLDGPFVAGREITGNITYPGYEHLPFTAHVERIEPERLFSFRWHPYAGEPGFDYSAEPGTLVEFRLAEVPGGTELTIVESGFDSVPESRRREAFVRNEGGWTIQLDNVRRHVDG